MAGAMITETWRWQGGILRGDVVLSAAIGPNGSSVLAGYTNTNSSVVSSKSRDWMAVKLDAAGTARWRWQGESSGDVQHVAAAMGQDGSVVVAGTVQGKSSDFAAVKLDNDGTLLWDWQDGSAADDTLHAVALTKDGSAILAGSTTGVWGEASIGLDNFAALKLDAEGELLWTWQDGTEDFDRVLAAVVDDGDDSVVLTGYSSGDWSGTSSAWDDCVAVKLDANGNELWRWQSKTKGSDACTAAMIGPNGSIMLAGRIKSSLNGRHARGYSRMSAVKLDSSGDECWRWQDATARRYVLVAATIGNQGSVVLAGTMYRTCSKSRESGHIVAAVKLDAGGVGLWRLQDYTTQALTLNPAAIAVSVAGEILLGGSTKRSCSGESTGASNVAAVKLELGASIPDSPYTALPYDTNALVTLAPNYAHERTTRTRNRESSFPERPAASSSSSGSPDTSISNGLQPELRFSAGAPVPITPAAKDLPTTFMSTVRIAMFPEVLVIGSPPSLYTPAIGLIPAPPGAISTASPNKGHISDTESVIKRASTLTDPPVARLLAMSLAPIASPAAVPSPVQIVQAPPALTPTSSPTAPFPTLSPPSQLVQTPSVSATPTPPSWGPTSPAPASTSQAPSSPAPSSSAPSPTPTPTSRTSSAPISTTLTPEAPTPPPSPSSTTASTSPAPRSTVLPSSPPNTPAPTPLPTSPAPRSTVLPSSPPNTPAPTPLPTSTATTTPEPTLQPTTSPIHDTLEPASPSPTLPKPTQPALEKLAPTSQPQTTPSPTSPVPLSPSPTLPEPTSAVPTPPLPTPPTPSPSPGIPQSPEPTSLPTTPPPTPRDAVSPHLASPSPAPRSPTAEPSERTPPSQAPMGTPHPSTPNPSLASLPLSSEAPTPNSPSSGVLIGVVCAAAAVAAIVLGVCLCLRKRHSAKKKIKVQVAPNSARITPGIDLDGDQFSQPAFFPVLDAVEEIPGLPLCMSTPCGSEIVPAASCLAVVSSTTASPTCSALAFPVLDINKADDDVLPAIGPEYRAAITPSGKPLRVMGSLGSSPGNDIAQAVAEAAGSLALNSRFPGICEAATLVLILVGLVSDEQSCSEEVELRLKRCRLVMMILQRASTVLGKGNDIKEDMERMLIKDVQTAVGDMVELIKTYRSKRKISQVIVSTMFRRRMEEAEAVIDRAISDLKLGLHVHSEINREEDRLTVRKHWRNLNERMHDLGKDGEHETDGLKGQQREDESIAEAMASARRLRRQRNLSQIEIPEDHVTISEELLGKGGFGSVYIADYNGRNAAAKVWEIIASVEVVNIDMTHCDLSTRYGDGTGKACNGEGIHADHQRMSLLSEVQTMIRLRSPHTVNVYGVMTTAKDRLVLMMELLTGGDLRSFLRYAEERLPESLTRQLIGDVCAGVAFLHSKKAVHGDLKSPNILLDGECRAKIADFGTSRWAKHGDSTGLATYRTNAGNIVQLMSFAWAAPEVLYAKGSSYASDVYSFGVVAWEVLSMEVPWADEDLPLDIYRRVVFKGDRPPIPRDAPADIADIVRACWAGPPGERPTSSELVRRLNSPSTLANGERPTSSELVRGLTSPPTSATGGRPTSSTIVRRPNSTSTSATGERPPSGKIVRRLNSTPTSAHGERPPSGKIVRRLNSTPTSANGERPTSIKIVRRLNSTPTSATLERPTSSDRVRKLSSTATSATGERPSSSERVRKLNSTPTPATGERPISSERERKLNSTPTSPTGERPTSSERVRKLSSTPTWATGERPTSSERARKLNYTPTPATGERPISSEGVRKLNSTSTSPTGERPSSSERVRKLNSTPTPATGERPTSSERARTLNSTPTPATGERPTSRKLVRRLNSTPTSATGERPTSSKRVRRLKSTPAAATGERPTSRELVTKLESPLTHKGSPMPDVAVPSVLEPSRDGGAAEVSELLEHEELST